MVDAASSSLKLLSEDVDALASLSGVEGSGTGAGPTQKARDADVFGPGILLVSVTSYLPLISHLCKIVAKAQKKSYAISVGKLNPAKLAIIDQLLVKLPALAMSNEEEDRDQDQSTFSLVTGKYRHAKRFSASTWII
ncbi:hypothetical protein HD554DRAFT_2123166 [Boletus coccyginus]|nr:hypothetical protein HD554DRAFT_2123166 [Boletus coccyginus]